MTGSHKLLALICLFPFLISASAQSDRSTPSSAPANISAPFVFTANVSDKRGRVVIGLTKDDFEVLVDKLPVPLISCEVHDTPLSVGVIFDASGSVVPPGSNKAARAKVADLQRALKGFIERSNHANEYFVVAFNKTPQLLLDWSSDSKAIVDALGGVEPQGNTAFYDACYLAIDKVQHGRQPKRVLLVISDGQDNNSSYLFKQVREALRESDILLYSINVSGPPQVITPIDTEGQEILDELSALSGGLSFSRLQGKHRRFMDAASPFEQIAIELRNQYTIAIKPDGIDNAIGKWHKLKLKVKSPDKIKLETLTREGFYLNHR